MIRFYCCYYDKDEIGQYVEKNFNDDDCSFFIMNRKVSLIEMIINVIDHFKELKENKLKNK